MRIAIIDDGISYIYLKNSDIIQSIKIGSDLLISEDRELHDLNHATECALIIKKYHADVKFISINIFTKEKNVSTVEQLIKGIYWACEKNISLIHFSLGSIYYGDRDKLLLAINYAVERNIIIVAPTSNDGWLTYPAVFTNVISVESIKSKKDSFYRLNKYTFNNTYFSASSCHHIEIQLENGKIEKFDTPQCNSYAAPFISAIIANLLKYSENYTIISIINKLAFMQDSYQRQIRLYMVDWLNRKNTIEIKNIEYIDNVDKKYKTIIFDSIATKTIQIKQEISLLTKTNKNIIYLNPFVDAYEQFKQYALNKFVYCTPQEYDWVKEFTLEDREFDIPIVYLKYNEPRNIEILGKKIKQHSLFLNSYSSLHVSDFYRAVLLDMNFIPKLNLIKNQKNILGYIYNYIYIGLIEILLFHCVEDYDYIIPYCDIYLKIIQFENDIITFSIGNVKHKKNVFQFCKFLIELFEGETNDM